MRRLGWKFWLVVALIIGAMAVASLTSNDDADLVLIREVSVRVEARCNVLRPRTDAVYGDLQDGEARQHYEQAAILLAPLAARVSDFGALAGNWSEVPHDPELSRLLQPAIAAMRAGAHCRLVSGPAPSVTSDVWSRATWLTCSSLLADGKDVEAVEVWLDALVMFVDADVAPDGVEPFTSHWTDERIASISVPGRERLSQGLSWLGDKVEQPIDWERSLEPMASMSCSVALFSSNGWMGQLMAWDCGFSPQRKGMKAFATAFRALPVLSPVAEKWSDRWAQFDAFENAVRAVYGEAAWAGIMRYREVWRRRSLAHLRLLGAALTIHSGQVPGPVRDPLGDGFITVLERGDQWQLSAGRDVLMCKRTVEK